MAENPFEAFGREFRRAIQDHGELLNEEMKRVQEQVHSAMEQMRTEMEKVGEELQRVMRSFHEERGDASNWYEICVTADRVDEPPPKKSRKTKKKKARAKRRSGQSA